MRHRFLDAKGILLHGTNLGCSKVMASHITQLPTSVACSVLRKYCVRSPGDVHAEQNACPRFSRSTIEAGGTPHGWADMPLFPRLDFQLSLVPPRVSGKLLPPKPGSCGPALKNALLCSIDSLIGQFFPLTWGSLTRLSVEDPGGFCQLRGPSIDQNPLHTGFDIVVLEPPGCGNQTCIAVDSAAERQQP